MTVVAPWRGILAVEPDSGVLSAKAVLLTKANYCVTPATGLGNLFSLGNTKAFALAILSDRLGPRQLGVVAETVRRQWPRIRILILGQVSIALEDYLYDEHICRSSDPRRVLIGTHQGQPCALPEGQYLKAIRPKLSLTPRLKTEFFLICQRTFECQ